MTLVLGITSPDCNFIYADTTLSTGHELFLDRASKIGRLSEDYAYGIIGDVLSSYSYLSKLRIILKDFRCSTYDQLLKKIKFSLADLSGYLPFEILLSSYHERNYLTVIRSNGSIVTVTDGAVVLGSGASEVHGQLHAPLNALLERRPDLNRFGLAVLSILNQWALGASVPAALKNYFGGTFLYLAHNRDAIHFSPPVVNLRAHRTPERLIFTTSGFVFHKGAAILFNSETGDRQIVVSNLDREFEVLLEQQFGGNAVSFEDECRKIFESTAFQTCTLIDDKYLGHGSLRPPLYLNGTPQPVPEAVMSFGAQILTEIGGNEILVRG